MPRRFGFDDKRRRLTDGWWTWALSTTILMVLQRCCFGLKNADYVKQRAWSITVLCQRYSSKKMPVIWEELLYCLCFRPASCYGMQMRNKVANFKRLWTQICHESSWTSNADDTTVILVADSARISLEIRTESCWRLYFDLAREFYLNLTGDSSRLLQILPEYRWKFWQSFCWGFCQNLTRNYARISLEILLASQWRLCQNLTGVYVSISLDILSQSCWRFCQMQILSQSRWILTEPALGILTESRCRFC